MITRKDYLNDSTKLHDKYFLQFATEETYRAVLGRFDVTALLAMYVKDKYFNKMPAKNGTYTSTLKAWDGLCRSGLFNRGEMQAIGELCTLSTMVCTLRAVARDTVMRTVEENVMIIADLNRDKIEDGEEISATEFAKRIKESAEYGRQSYANTQADVITIYGGYWTNEIKSIVHTWDSVITIEIGGKYETVNAR